MCNLDYDRADFYNQTDRVARKPHLCSECGREIMPKEKYRYAIGIWEKKINYYKTCSHCLVGQKWLWEQCGGYLHHGLEEEILEHAADYRRIDLYRFVVNMRKQWINVRVPSLKNI